MFLRLERHAYEMTSGPWGNLELQGRLIVTWVEEPRMAELWRRLQCPEAKDSYPTFPTTHPHEAQDSSAVQRATGMHTMHGKYLPVSDKRLGYS